MGAQRRNGGGSAVANAALGPCLRQDTRSGRPDSPIGTPNSGDSGGGPFGQQDWPRDRRYAARIVHPRTGTLSAGNRLCLRLIIGLERARKGNGDVWRPKRRPENALADRDRGPEFFVHERRGSRGDLPCRIYIRSSRGGKSVETHPCRPRGFEASMDGVRQRCGLSPRDPRTIRWDRFSAYLAIFWRKWAPAIIVRSAALHTLFLMRDEDGDTP